jgi:hypothetical protein
MKKQIISISGFKGHGKDTVGQILKTHFGWDTMSFADPLKHTISVMFDWEYDMLEGITPESRAWREQPDPFWSQKLGYEFTPRKAMTQIGSDLIRRKFNDDHWCDLMHKRLVHITNTCVITDTRFKKELSMVKTQGGICVWVKRDPLPAWYSQALWLNNRPEWQQQIIKPFLGKLHDVHYSETNWLGWDFDHVIENTGSITDLTTLVLEWAQSITAE